GDWRARKRIAVIENEFGEIGIDDALVVNADEESMALHPCDQPIAARRIAERTGISTPFLTQVLAACRNAGLIRADRAAPAATASLGPRRPSRCSTSSTRSTPRP